MLPKLRRIVRRNELLRNSLRRVYRFVQYTSARFLGRLRKDGFQLLDVNPNQIELTVNLTDATLKGNQVWHFGSVSEGDWDQGGVPVRAYNQVFEIADQFCIQKRSWGEIPAYLDHLRLIQAGEFIDGCENEQQYHSRWLYLKKLFLTIEENGYQTQTELGSDNPLDEVRVQIGRRGQILLEEGLHRLVIAQLMNLPCIPVLVTRRHAEWNALRQAVIKIIIQRGFIHQPFNHPDLDSLPQIYGNHLKEASMYGNERWDFILESLPLKSGTVLDIGSYFGYFPQRLEDLGFECVALEPDRENLEVLTRYRDMMEKHFEVCKKTLFEIDRYEFDLVLALNIFHHLVKTQQDHDRLVVFLERLNCQFMYFEPDPNQDQEAYKSFSDDEFINFVLRHSSLQFSKFLGRTREGRGFYLLSATPW